MLEGGCTADTRHQLQEKIQKKRQQYKQLMQALTLREYDARLMVFTFGVGGSIFQRAKDDPKELEVDFTTSKRVLSDIQFHSVEHVAKIVICAQRRIIRIMDRKYSPMHLTAGHRQACFPIPSSRLKASFEDFNS